MQRGFADLPDESSGDKGPLEAAYEETSSVNGESEPFTYRNKKALLTEQEIVSVAIHDLKLSHHLSQVASIDITALLESFPGEAHCWDYRTTQNL